MQVFLKCDEAAKAGCWNVWGPPFIIFAPGRPSDRQLAHLIHVQYETSGPTMKLW